jgi:CysZ protein
MIGQFFKSLQQLSDPTLRHVVRFGVVSAAIAYGLSVVMVWLVLSQVTFFQTMWMDLGTGLALGLAALIVPLLFFPALSTALMGLKLDDVADAVERRHYPHLPAPRSIGLAESLAISLRFLGLMAVLNLLALPVYIALLFIGFGFLLGLALNGYLLAREFFEMVAVRHLSQTDMRLMFRRNLGWLWLRGILIAFLFSIPFFNLLVPVIATSFMVHSFQSLRQQTERL